MFIIGVFSHTDCKLNRIFHVIYLCDQFVAPEIRHSRRHCSVCQQSTWYSATRTRFWWKSLYLKGYTAKRLTGDFPEKSWTKRGPGSPNSSDLNAVYYRIWGLMQEQVYKTAVCNAALTSGSASLRLARAFHHRLSSTKPLTSGVTTTSTRCNQPALFRATHILSKKIAMPSYA